MVPQDHDVVLGRVLRVESLMKDGMLDAVPGKTAKVETVVTRSLNKRERVIPDLPAAAAAERAAVLDASLA